MAETQLAEQNATLEALGATVTPENTNEVKKAAPSSQVISEYRSNMLRLESLAQRLRDLQNQFTEESTIVKAVRKQISEAEGLKEKLEKEHPELATVTVPTQAAPGTQIDPRTERARAFALGARVKTLKEQMEKFRTEASELDKIALDVSQLERKRQLQETNYLYYSSSLERSRTDDTLGVAQMSNINKVQAPSPPGRNISRIQKAMIGVLFLGFAGGIGLAFFLELIVDRTVKRPGEIENRLGYKLYLSVPEMEGHDEYRARSWRTSFAKLNLFKRKSAKREMLIYPENAQSKEKLEEALRPFHEALRDRVVMFFDEEKITKKPKIIGVTSCSRGAGVTTVASGLAASLSNIGDGKVLVVDLNPENGGVQRYFNGSSVKGLLDVFDKEKPELNLPATSDKLDVVAVNAQNGAISVRSKQFTDLLPKLRGSDYDYIVFDLPPVNQTSVTMRLAGFMDEVLFVIEAGKTNRKVVKRSLAQLSASNRQVATIMNKAPCVVPDWLDSEV